MAVVAQQVVRADHQEVHIRRFRRRVDLVAAGVGVVQPQPVADVGVAQPAGRVLGAGDFVGALAGDGRMHVGEDGAAVDGARADAAGVIAGVHADFVLGDAVVREYFK